MHLASLTAVLDLGRINYAACGTDRTIFIDEKGQRDAKWYGSSGQLRLGSEADQSVPQRLCGEAMDGRNLGWTDAGGRFSVVAHSPVDELFTVLLLCGGSCPIVALFFTSVCFIPV